MLQLKLHKHFKSRGNKSHIGTICSTPIKVLPAYESVYAAESVSPLLQALCPGCSRHSRAKSRHWYGEGLSLGIFEASGSIIYQACSRTWICEKWNESFQYATEQCECKCRELVALLVFQYSWIGWREMEGSIFMPFIKMTARCRRALWAPCPSTQVNITITFHNVSFTSKILSILGEKEWQSYLHGFETGTNLSRFISNLF